MHTLDINFPGIVLIAFAVVAVPAAVHKLRRWLFLKQISRNDRRLREVMDWRNGE
jgi:hypothetical protein